MMMRRGLAISIISLMEASEGIKSRNKRVLIAMDLRSYCEAVAGALQGLCPDTSVFQAEAGDLDRETARLRPDLVVCSRVTRLVEGLVPNWVELYPDHGLEAIVSLCGARSTLEGAQLSDLVSVVNRSEPAPSV